MLWWCYRCGGGATDAVVEAAAAIVATEDYARRFESGDIAVRFLHFYHI